MTDWLIDLESAIKFMFNVTVCCLRVLPNYCLLLDLTQNISLTSHPFFSSLSLHLCLCPLFCLGLCFTLQKSVIQQLDSPGWRQFVCAGRSPHSPPGPQLHQPHHRRSLQRPQGRTHPVSTHSPILLLPSPKTPNNPLITEIKAKICHLGTMKAWIFNFSFVSCDISFFGLINLFIWLEKAELFIIQDRFDLNLHSCLFMWDFLLLWGLHSSLLPWFCVATPYFSSVLPLFFQSSFVLAFSFGLEQLFPTNLNQKVFHIAYPFKIVLHF